MMDGPHACLLSVQASALFRPLLNAHFPGGAAGRDTSEALRGRTTSPNDVRTTSLRSALGRRAALLLATADVLRAQGTFEQRIEGGGDLLGGLARPRMDRSGRTLCLLHDGAFGQRRIEHQGTEHLTHLGDSVVVLGRSGADAVDDESQRLDVRGPPLTQLVGGTQRTIGSGHREQAGLGHDRHAAARGPRGASETVETGRAVDEDEAVALRNPGQRIVESAQVALRQGRTIELRGPGRPGDHVEMTELLADPPGGDDRLGEDLLGLRSGQDIGDIDPRRGRHIEARRRIRLGIHIDDQGRYTPVVGRRGETERHGCLTDSAFEAADT